MGALAVNASMECKNFRHIVFNNGAHDSVGGQPTVAPRIDMVQLAKSVGYDWVGQAQTADEIIAATKKLRHHHGTVFLEIRVKKGFRKNLSRPTTTPLENKNALMDYLSRK